MRIGIDASRAFVDQPTGTERYAFEVITRILKLPEAREHEWVLYVKKNQSLRVKSQSFRSKVKIIEISLPYLWTQTGLAFRTWIDGLDVLWVPAHTLPLLRKPGIKTVVTIHGIEYEWLPAYENKLQKWYLPLSTQYAVRIADKIIAVSEFTKDQLIKRLGAHRERIKVILEGYETQISKSKSQLIDKSKTSIFNKFDIEPQNYILFIGTVQPRKNLERLVEAFAGLHFGGAESDRLKLVIAGKWGWGYTRTLQAPQKWDVKERVTLLGYVDDYTKRVLLENALVYVQPSITEGFGIPVLEAMAVGVPVVSSNGGALSEVVGKAGLLFNPFDVREISNSLKLMINSKYLRQKLIKRGLMRAKSFSWEKAALETFKLIVSNSS